MTILQLTHLSRQRERRGREHPDATLAVTVVFGAVALAWFAFHLWSVLTGGGPLQ